MIQSRKDCAVILPKRNAEQSVGYGAHSRTASVALTVLRDMLNVMVGQRRWPIDDSSKTITQTIAQTRVSGTCDYTKAALWLIILSQDDFPRAHVRFLHCGACSNVGSKSRISDHRRLSNRDHTVKISRSTVNAAVLLRQQSHTTRSGIVIVPPVNLTWQRKCQSSQLRPSAAQSFRCG